ncbi:uncharacterized protein LOC122650556 [Telopea speciosissima]|uniref:uncharacterized protein LOC122650556 n=1 Tax=Telopea speciosissima TaxID=54955 RepID=UPI001CC39EE8|nr:uncharacterized protein LOC122650556 [Telopea speciosissima]
MVAEKGDTREEVVKVLSTVETSNAARERCSGSCSSSSAGVVCGDYSKCEMDRMVKMELDAARALADFAQLALLESENPNYDSCGKWGNKGKRSWKRSKNSFPGRDWRRDLESSESQSNKLRSSDPSKEGSMIDRSQRRRACKVVVTKTVKVEQESESASQHPMCPTSYVSFGGGRSKQNLSEAEKEARRLRRILANRESARQTIRRRQAFYEELTKKASDLAWDNENMKQEKELVMKEYQSLKDKNEQLKAQMVKTIKAEAKITPEEKSSLQGYVSISD